MIKKAFDFIRESREELRKVSWPDRDEVTSFTIVVVVAVVFIAVFLWLVDTMLMSIIKRVMY
ncbi:MAG: preprotein translocase subunit SecE [Spirochaetota bacterium]|nr:preprotein translocase subunit SecE [Spirochaetota bacterium]